MSDDAKTPEAVPAQVDTGGRRIEVHPVCAGCGRPVDRTGDLCEACRPRAKD